MAGKVYNFQQVAKHNKKGDCWIIISGKVYDVTTFLEDHPGGDEVLLLATGKDATPEFEDVGHSSDADAKMKELYVGDIDQSTIPTTKQELNPPPATSSAVAADTDDSSKLLLYILPLLVLGVAFILRFYMKEEQVPV